MLRLNTGDTTYGPSIRINFPSGKRYRPGDIKLTDLNKDGFPDLFMTDTDMDGDQTDTLYYALGAPNYQYNEPVRIALAAPVRKFILTDIDGDGYEDLAATCTNQHVYVSLPNAGSIEENDHHIRLYPNPAQKTVHVRDEWARAKIITLYNTAGQPLLTNDQQRNTHPIVHRRTECRYVFPAYSNAPRSCYIVVPEAIILSYTSCILLYVADNSH